AASHDEIARDVSGEQAEPLESNHVDRSGGRAQLRYEPRFASIHPAHPRATPTASRVTLEATRPIVMPRMISVAVMPSAMIDRISSNVVLSVLANWTRPLAIRNSKTPGMSATTDANPIAANGMCHWRAIGVSSRPTASDASAALVVA